MAVLTTKNRKQITDLNQPIQISELNRQLDWIWKQLLGGINMKSVNDETREVINNKITNEQMTAAIEVLDDSIRSTVNALDGRVSTVEQTADSITSNVSNLTGRTSTIEQTVNGIESTVTELDGHISVVEQTASGISSAVAGLNGRISSVEQTASGLSSTVTGINSRVSAIEQRPEGVAVKLHDANDNFDVNVAYQPLYAVTSTVHNGYGLSFNKNGRRYFGLGVADNGRFVGFANERYDFMAKSGSYICDFSIDPQHPAIFAQGGSSGVTEFYLDSDTGYLYGSSTIHTGSDRRLKRDIAPIESAEKVFDALRPVQFRMIAQGDGAPLHYGFIAQDVEDALTAAGIGETAFLDRPTDRSPHYGLAYDQFIALCVSKVQAQQTRINDLERRIRQLEARL